MKTAFQRQLPRHRGHLLEVKRIPKGIDRITGFAVAWSSEVVLFHRFDWDTFQLNGYTAVREPDISAFRFFSRSGHWQFRAAVALKLQPIVPAGIEVSSIASLITSAAASFPLLSFHPEIRDRDVCYIGPVLKLTAQTCLIDDLGPGAEWSGARRLRLADITRIDFGGGYEQALAMTAPKRKAN